MQCLANLLVVGTAQLLLQVRQAFQGSLQEEKGWVLCFQQLSHSILASLDLATCVFACVFVDERVIICTVSLSCGHLMSFRGYRIHLVSSLLPKAVWVWSSSQSRLPL